MKSSQFPKTGNTIQRISLKIFIFTKIDLSMMTYTIIRRLETEVRILQNLPYLSKKAIQEQLEQNHDLPITKRTLERDFQALKYDFGIDIHFDRSKNGYTLNPDNPYQILSFLQFAGRIYLGNLLHKSLKNSTNLSKVVKLEDNSNFKGLENLPLLLKAIRNRIEIHFVHENFHKGTRKAYEILPLQLREYQGRWYIVGVPVEESHIKTFGLARLSKLKELEVSQINPAEYKEQLLKFNQVVGLNYDGAPSAEAIELAISRTQYPYLKTLPLHSSQRFVEELMNGWVKIRLFLIPNYELKMQLLKLGDQVEVLKPNHLREEIQATLKNALSLYRKS